MKNLLLIALLMSLLLTCIKVNAEIKLPAIVSSNMVLQRNTTVKLWGWAEPAEKITIKVSWLTEAFELEADESGNWQVDVKTTGDKKPQSIILKSTSSNIVLGNVLLGEVWLCSGQSNMEQPLMGYSGEPTYHASLSVAYANNPNLRLFTVKRNGSKTSLENVEKYEAWQAASPQNVLNFSAVAYFFGKQLQEVLNVPVGIIQSTWGASPVQSWMSTEALNRFEKFEVDKIEDITVRTNKIPTALFNGMIHPIIRFTLKGALWYQGEANRHYPDYYKTLFPAMVADWRTHWAIGDFPFYYAQIAPFSYKEEEHTYETVKNTAFMREAQLKCQDLIPNSGMVVTLDIGRKNTIHPPQKKEVADRFLFHALHQTYGYEKIDCFSPTYKTHEPKDGGILLKFDHAEMGVFAIDKLEGFEIAGKDKVFYPATAQIIDKHFVLVKSEEVLKPIAVRYGWQNWIQGTLYDTNMLPASSFRTDDWEDATRIKK